MSLAEALAGFARFDAGLVDFDDFFGRVAVLGMIKFLRVSAVGHGIRDRTDVHRCNGSSGRSGAFYPENCADST